MLRILSLGLVIFALGAGFKNGWLVIKWSQFFHDIGYTSIDPKQPMNWSKFLLDKYD